MNSSCGVYTRRILNTFVSLQFFFLCCSCFLFSPLFSFPLSSHCLGPSVLWYVCFIQTKTAQRRAYTPLKLHGEKCWCSSKTKARIRSRSYHKIFIHRTYLVSSFLLLLLLLLVISRRFIYVRCMLVYV